MSRQNILKPIQPLTIDINRTSYIDCCELSIRSPAQISSSSASPVHLQNIDYDNLEGSTFFQEKDQLSSPLSSSASAPLSPLSVASPHSFSDSNRTFVQKLKISNRISPSDNIGYQLTTKEILEDTDHETQQHFKNATPVAISSEALGNINSIDLLQNNVDHLLRCLESIEDKSSGQAPRLSRLIMNSPNFEVFKKNIKIVNQESSDPSPASTGEELQQNSSNDAARSALSSELKSHLSKSNNEAIDSLLQEILEELQQLETDQHGKKTYSYLNYESNIQEGTIVESIHETRLSCDSNDSLYDTVCVVCKQALNFNDNSTMNCGSKVVHTACSKCVFCKTPYKERMEFKLYYDHFVCQNDAYRLESPQCGQCHRIIQSEPIFALGTTWHPGHLHCTQCKTSFKHKFEIIEHNDKVYCHNDYTELFALKCGCCNKILEGEAITAQGNRWHVGCFHCQVCEAKFEGESCFIHNGLPYCRFDYHYMNNSLCKACKLPIEGACLQAESNKYHPNCFACMTCKKPLKKKYHIHADQIFCDKHHKSKLAPKKKPSSFPAFFWKKNPVNA